MLQTVAWNQHQRLKRRINKGKNRPCQDTKPVTYIEAAVSGFNGQLSNFSPRLAQNSFSSTDATLLPNINI